MVNECDQTFDFPEGSVQRRFVQILYHNVVISRSKILPIIPVREKWICVSRSHAVHIDAVYCCATCRVIPPAAKQSDGVTASREAPEYLMKVKLCAARLRIFSVLPVEDENFH